MAVAQVQVFEDAHPLVQSCPLLNELRLTEEIEDLTINLKDNGRVHAHRIILAARIPTLRRTLRGPCGQENTVLSWPTVSLSMASALLEYVYTGRVEITEANVRGVVTLAKTVNLVELADWGTTFMTNSLNLDNLATTWDCAQTLKMQPLITSCINLMKTNFEEIICTDLFVHLPPETLLNLLHDDSLSVASEEAVFAAIACWVGPGSEDCNERLKRHAPAMLKEVRWLQTSLKFRRGLVADNDIFRRSNACLGLFLQVEQWMHDKDQADCPFNRNKRPVLDTWELIVFGQDKNQDRWSVLGFNADIQGEERISDMEGRQGATYSFMGRQTNRNLRFMEESYIQREKPGLYGIFMVGGGGYPKPSSRVSEFLPRERRWTERAPLAVARHTHAACALLHTGNQATLLGVFGGQGIDGASLSSCEVYSVSEDRWYRLPDLQEVRFSPAAACVPGDSRVFVLGGHRLASVVYCELGGDWQERARAASGAAFWLPAAPMRRTHDVGLAAAAFRGRILAAGGWGDGPRAVEMFCLPDAAKSPHGQWTDLAAMSQPHYYFTLLASGDDRVFALGGLDFGNSVEAFIAPEGAAASTNDLTSWTWSSKTPIEDIGRIWGAVFLRM